MRSVTLQIGLIFSFLLNPTRTGFSREIIERSPAYRVERVIATPENTDSLQYLAFPAALDLRDEVLVSFKHGRSHADDAGALLDLVHLGKTSRHVSEPRTFARLDDKIMQMGEWVRFPNGAIANYIDVQQVADSSRVGLHVVRSSDGGRTFGPLERVGVINGVEYGYAFDSVSRGTTTWMLAMTFSNLPGGQSVYPPRPQAGSVNILRTDDHGQSWRFVRNLSAEFGNNPINESTLINHGSGFMISTRGYDNHQRVHLTDMDFKIQKQVDLTAKHPFISRHVGRPRLFARDGQVYLLGRNYTEPTGPMKLCLFRLDTTSLEVESYAVLDNKEGANVTDGYYAVPYFRTDGERTHLNVVTYKGVNKRPPQIVEFEYHWDEVK